MSDWKEMISGADRAILEKGSWGRRAGFGGAARAHRHRWPRTTWSAGRATMTTIPLSCGDVGWEAVGHIGRIAAVCRDNGVAGVLHPVRAREGRLGRRDVRPQDRRRTRRETSTSRAPTGRRSWPRSRRSRATSLSTRRSRAASSGLPCRHTSTTGRSIRSSSPAARPPTACVRPPSSRRRSTTSRSSRARRCSTGSRSRTKSRCSTSTAASPMWLTTAEVLDYLARLPRRNHPSEPFPD